MTLESTVLVIALFGSAKAAFDLIVSAYKRLRGPSLEGKDLEKAVSLLESLSAANEVLREENQRIKTINIQLVERLHNEERKRQ